MIKDHLDNFFLYIVLGVNDSCDNLNPEWSMPAPQNYPYLLSTLIGAAIVLTVYLLASKERRIMLIGGAALVPFSFCAILHETSYWNAGRLGGFSWGIEDVLFTLSVGSLTAAIGARVLRLDLPVRITWQSAAKKFILLCFSATFLVFILTLAGMDIMFATIATQIVIIPLLTAASHHGWWRPPLAALIYTLYYTVMLHIFFHLFAGFADHWNAPDLWPVRIFGLPLEEITWVFTFAWCWILMLAFCLDTKISVKEELYEHQ